MSNKQLNIIFCIPGNSFSNKFLQCWTNLLAWCHSNNITPYLSTAYSSNVFFVRNMCLKGNNLDGIHQKPFQGKINYDYIMWIDSDQVFSPEQFSQLLKHDKDIVSGMYIMADNMHYAVVENIDTKYLLENGSYKFLSRNDVKQLKNKDLMKVDYCGMGFMLVKYGVLEKFNFPWFRPTSTTIKNENGDIILHDYNSEDYHFCYQSRKLGFDVFVDPNIIVGHEKKVVLG